MTSAAQMIAAQHKWWRWLGEESLSGGTIGLHEGGNTFPCGVRRPSEHSMMRWIGFDLDQVGLEHMVARITGMRNAGQMSVQNTATGTVAKDSVLWLETGHPRFHELNVTWRIGGPTGQVIPNNNSRNLDLEPLNLAPGTVVWAEARDPVGPNGNDWVRNPSTNNSATDSGYNGPRFVQTRQWTVGDTTVTPSPPAADITARRANTHPVAGDEVVYVETNHPTDRVLPVTWSINGVDDRQPEQQPQPRPREAEPDGGDAHAEGHGDRRRDVGLGGVEDRQDAADRAAAAVRAADQAGRHARAPGLLRRLGHVDRHGGRPDRLHGPARRRGPAPCGPRTAGSTTSGSRSSRCPSRRSSSATPART